MRQDVTSTLAAAIASPLGLVGRPTLSIYLDTGTRTWTWDSEDPAEPVYFNIGQLYMGNGMDPASLEVTIYSAAQVIDGSSVQQAALGAAAVFRGRRLTLGRAIETDAGTETLTVFDGTITQVRASTQGVTLLATGAMSSADQRQGTMQIELMCPWVLYSTDCGAARVESNLTTVAGSTATVLHVAAIGASTPNDLVTLPNGETALVRSAAAGAITLDRPVVPPASGLVVKLTMGCRKTFSDCRDRHNNAGRYGGCPWRPVKLISIGG